MSPLVAVIALFLLALSLLLYNTECALEILLSFTPADVLSIRCTLQQDCIYPYYVSIDELGNILPIHVGYPPGQFSPSFPFPHSPKLQLCMSIVLLEELTTKVV